ncbi:hypothetical protein GE061_019549 [Apolygus lucorum]|uniref:Uncharacterized protein n=1 Tax=Apolygus lucorum TaxID=248454 RepID=A0A8S9XAQ3_APOLU|nr:hypothetical protein GE061_019549 [Apolygus lucorum]
MLGPTTGSEFSKHIWRPQAQSSAIIFGDHRLRVQQAYLTTTGSDFSKHRLRVQPAYLTGSEFSKHIWRAQAQSSASTFGEHRLRVQQAHLTSTGSEFSQHI